MYTKDRCLFVCLDLAPKVLDESQKKASKEFLSVSFGALKALQKWQLFSYAFPLDGSSPGPASSRWREPLPSQRRPQFRSGTVAAAGWSDETPSRLFPVLMAIRGKANFWTLQVGCSTTVLCSVGRFCSGHKRREVHFCVLPRANLFQPSHFFLDTDSMSWSSKIYLSIMPYTLIRAKQKL